MIFIGWFASLILIWILRNHLDRLLKISVFIYSLLVIGYILHFRKYLTFADKDLKIIIISVYYTILFTFFSILEGVTFDMSVIISKPALESVTVGNITYTCNILGLLMLELYSNFWFISLLTSGSLFLLCIILVFTQINFPKSIETESKVNMGLSLDANELELSNQANLENCQLLNQK